MEEISNYINKRNNTAINKKDLLVCFYYLVIKIEEFQKNVEKILLLSAELGITFIVFLYIENGDNNIIFPKNYINSLITIILVYSPEDIIKIFIKKTKLFKF